MPPVRGVSLPPNAATRDGLRLWLTLTPQAPIDKLGFGHSSSLCPLTLMAIMVVTTVLCHPSHLRLRMLLKVLATPCSSLQCVSML